MRQPTIKQAAFVEHYKYEHNAVAAYKAAYNTDDKCDAYIHRRAHEMRERLAEYIKR